MYKAVSSHGGKVSVSMSRKGRQLLLCGPIHCGIIFSSARGEMGGAPSDWLIDSIRLEKSGMLNAAGTWRKERSMGFYLRKVAQKW